jgi:hypothetical protein
MLRPAGAVAATALAAIALGCGGGSSGEGGDGGDEPAKARVSIATATSLTKPRFVVHVNDLCRRKWRFVMNAVKQTRVLWERQYPRVNDQKNFIRSVRLSFFASLNYLIFDWVRKLGAPPGDKRAVEELLGATREATDRGSGRPSFTTTLQVKALFTLYNREARSYGLDRCLVSGAHLPHPET